MRPWRLLAARAPAIGTLVGAGIRSLRPARRNPGSFEPLLEETAAPSDRLVTTFLNWSGADPAHYTGVVPPHLFTQWGFSLMVRLMAQTRYPLARILNQGCSLRVNRPLPRGEALQLSARMVHIDEDAHRARLHMRLVTGTRSTPDALENDLYSVIVLGPKSAGGAAGDTAERRMVEIGTWSAGAGDGLDFALLTGDFNPIHWLLPAARLTPFRACILQGFGSFVRSYERITGHFGAPVDDIDVRFTRPVTLPTESLAVLRSARPGRDGRYRVKLESRTGTHLAGSFTRPG